MATITATVTAVRPGVDGLPTWCSWIADETGEAGELSYTDTGTEPLQVGDQFPIWGGC